ncbi:hypothetical protein, partial [Tenebrionicola larvae]
GIAEEILTYLISRHRGDLIELVAQSVDHKTLCLSFFTRPLLGIPQRRSGLFYARHSPADGECRPVIYCDNRGNFG